MSDQHRVKGFQQTAKIDGHEVTIITDEDVSTGKLMSFMLTCDLKNQLANDVLRCFTDSISIGLANGVNLETYVNEFTSTRFAPAGPVVGNAAIKSATSVIDYAMRELGISYLGRTDLYTSDRPVVDSDVEGVSANSKNSFGMRRQDIIVSSAALEEAVKSIINDLRFQKPNEQNELRLWQDTLDDLSNLLSILERLRERLLKGEVRVAADIVSDQRSLVETFSIFAEKNHTTIDSSFKMALAAGFIGLFQAMGADMQMTTPVVLAVFGGKKIIDTIKDLKKEK